VSHLVTVAFAVVGQHVDDQQTSGRLQCPPNFAERPLRFGNVVKHEHQHCRIEARIVDWERLELSTPQLHVLVLTESSFRGLQHRRGRVHSNDACDKGRERFARWSRAAAEVAHRPLAIRKSRERRQVKSIAEQLSAHAIPSPRRGRKELLRLGPSLSQHGLQPPLILLARGGQTRLLAYDCPQTFRRRIEAVTRQRVEIAGGLGAARHPSGIRQRFQVSADRRLRKLRDAAELSDGELVPIQQQEDAASSRVSERGEVVVDGRRLQSVYPDKRIHKSMRGVNVG
jgi:hypothetical protein